MRFQSLTLEHAERCLLRLGLSSPYTMDQLKSAYREKAFSTHPDHGGNNHDFNAVKEAYDYLLRYLDQQPSSRLSAAPETVTKDQRKNYGPCTKCHGTGIETHQVHFWDQRITYPCGYCAGTGEVELFNPVIPKMKMGNVNQERKPKKQKPNHGGRFVDKEYV